jgi:hypothetical protein
VASCPAVTVTPGRTAPVVSLTVPVSTASCANPAAGHAAVIAIINNPRTTLALVIAPPVDVEPMRTPDESRLEAKEVVRKGSVF